MNPLYTYNLNRQTLDSVIKRAGFTHGPSQEVGETIMVNQSVSVLGGQGDGTLGGDKKRLYSRLTKN